jgi:glutamine cyclotransferase
MLNLSNEYFGEGITIVGDRIIQLTWQSNVGFVYDMNSFELKEQFSYSTEGWGITYDGKQLIMSDGTKTLYFLDPSNFTVVRQINVTDNGTVVTMLNELEYIDGEIYANVWKTDRIARISPETGEVLGWIDLDGLLAKADVGTEGTGVLNGIAYDTVEKKLFVTGKNWPKIFEIKLVPVKE